jgi:hypothetical protein
MMRELLTLVPAPGQPWPGPARARWMAAFAAVAELVYEDGLPAEPQPPYVDDRSPAQPRTVDLRDDVDGDRQPTGRRARHRRPGP